MDTHFDVIERLSAFLSSYPTADSDCVVCCDYHRQLLLDCNIGDRPGGSEETEGVACLSAVSQHRALIFCQYKSMLDIIEQDLLK